MKSFKDLREGTKAPTAIGLHRAKAKVLQQKVYDSMKAWHAAQDELKAHDKAHPNRAKMDAAKQERDNKSNISRDPGRDTQYPTGGR